MSGEKTRSDRWGRRVLDVARKLSMAVARVGSTIWKRVRDVVPPEVGPASGHTDPRAWERGAVTAEYAIAMLATVHVPKRTWLGVCPAAREPRYCNESMS
jgi:hypothetical protein